MQYKLKDYDLVMSEIITLLNTKNVKLINSEKDGRINSTLSEKEITDVVIKNYKSIDIFNKWNLIVEVPEKSRYWYDMIIRNLDNSFYCPINIKISDLSKKSSDNISSKKGLFFSLTGLINQKCPNQWDQYFKILSTKIQENESDYFFLVVDKKNNDFFFNSLKRLKTLTPNGNNLPFQCKWYENKEIINRTFEESTIFLINNLHKSVIARAKILEEFDSSLKQNLNLLKKRS